MGLFGNLLNSIKKKDPATDIESFYFIGKTLGKGAFAEVKEITRKADGKKFAVKIIHKAKMKDDDDNAVQCEIEVLRQLHHPNIVGLVDLFQTKKEYYLIMELAHGGELFDRILAKGYYTEVDAAELVKQMLIALVYIHDEVGVVHRDLKPENLLFAEPSEHSKLLITDFGLARVLKENDFLSTTCGTPHYVAPEILKESGHSFPVDMWSVGVITYVLLAGYTPFWGGENNDEKLMYDSIIAGKYEFNHDWDMISPEAKNFISKLLLVIPNKRMTAAEALQHPWLSTKSNVDLLPHVKKNMKARMAFKKAIMAVRLINKLASDTSLNTDSSKESLEEKMKKLDTQEKHL